MGNLKKFSFGKRLLMTCVVVVLLTAMLATSAFAASYGIGPVVVDTITKTVTVPVTGANANQITLVARKDNANWLTDPNANVIYIDQVTGDGATTNIVFGYDAKWETTSGANKIFVGGSGMDVATADLKLIEGEMRTCTFIADGVTLPLVKVLDGGTVTPPAVPVKEHNIGVWGEGTPLVPTTAASFQNITADKTFTAIYTPIPTYTCTFIANEITVDTITVEQGGTVTPPAVPVVADKDGAWMEGNPPVPAVFTNITENKTYTAVYTVHVDGAFTVTKLYDAEDDGNLGQPAGKVLVEGTLATGNGTSKVVSGDRELLYSTQRQKYVGIVNASDVSGTTLTATITAEAPTTFTYGDLNGEDGIDNADLSNVKNWLSKRLSPAVILAADMDASGTIDNTDLSNMKNWLSKRLPFPALAK